MKKQPTPGRTAQEARAAAEKNWDRIMQDVSKGIIDRDAIVQAMDWLNQIDGEEMLKRQNDYLHKRKESMIDPDKSSGDPAMDAHYDHLRQQYQQLYGKDIKHG